MANTQTGFFGRVIGRTAAAYDGLNAIYLPAGVSKILSESVVREANLVRTGTPPFAILVAEQKSQDPNIQVVSRADAIRYRQGDRLAVVPATSVDIASFDGSFREAMGPGFPGTVIPGFDLHSLARTSIVLLVEGAGGDPDSTDLSGAQQQVKRCMETVAELLSEEREGAASWNRAWYELVDRALGALENILLQAATEGSARGYDEVIQSHVWGAFGLPRPSLQGEGLKSKPAQLVQALEDHWATQERIQVLTKEAALLGGSDADALDSCWTQGWEGVDDEVALQTSVLSGLQSFITSNTRLLQEFSRITEPAFCGIQGSHGSVRILTQDGLDASLVTSDTNGLAVLSSSLEAGEILSEPFRFTISPHVSPDLAQLKASRIEVRSASAGVSVVMCDGPLLRDGEIEFEVQLTMPLKTPSKMRKVVLEVTVPASDALVGNVRTQSTSLFVLPPVEMAVIVAPWTTASKTTLGTPIYVGPESVVAADGEVEPTSFEYELAKSNSHHRIILYAPESMPETQLLRLTQSARRGWWLGDLPPNTPAKIGCGGWHWAIETGGPAQTPQSLLVAALSDINVDPEDPPAEVTGSLRGRLETLIADRYRHQDFLEALGHVMLPSDDSVRLDSMDLLPPMLVPGEIANKWSTAMGTVAASPEWHKARDSFLNAWQSCVDLLPPLHRGDGGPSGYWPSKRSTVLLSERPGVLDQMLDDYATLVEAAEGEDPLVRFVSAFPFSASGWPMNVDYPECTCVLLSPWHPLRLAWMASVEATLRASERALELVGSVEGWRFPMVGPTPKKTQRMIAIPTEAGVGDIFAAWSMMVPLANEDPRQLRPPTALGGTTAPGSSASGLTASAAAAAMRDFRRVNSHLSSVTIDLASSSSTQRMEELDQSVLAALRTWVTGSEGVVGVSVRDSTNRHGDLPRSEVTNELRKGLGASLSWSRYKPVQGEAVKSNLRLLQDGGVRLAFLHEVGQRNGALGRIPLRRFEVPSRRGGHESTMEPGVARGTTPFSSALKAVEERKGNAPSIAVELKSTQLTDNNADWTISGQSFVSASLLAQALSQTSRGDTPPRMLWEWRPPFLTPDQGSPLNRRPYSSIIRVGQQLANRISEQLTQIGAAHDGSAKNVLETLGSQGIGLSSLLTMGGHHAAGALGFYLSIRLMELTIAPAGWIQIVMPIDSCRAFLDVLAPDSKSKETRRQADLIVIRAQQGQVCLIPLEIKMYGLDGEVGQGLPGPGPTFKEPLDQLAATTALLSRLQAERNRLSREGHTAESALWDNALATLIEAGLRLSRSATDRSAEALAAVESVVAGDYTLTLGRPLINFFQHHPAAMDEYQPYTEGSPDSCDVNDAYGALSARPGLVLRAVSSGAPPDDCQPLINSWTKLVNWAHRYAVAYPEGNYSPEVEPSSDDEGRGEDSLFIPDRGALVDEEVPALADPVDQASADSAQRGDATRDGGSDDQEAGSGDDSLPGEAEPGVGADPRASHDRDTTTSRIPSGAPREANEGMRLELGYVMDSVGKATADYWPGNTETTQLNMGVVGDLGTGKTQLVKALLYGMRKAAAESQEQPLSSLVFDYKRDFQDEAFVASVGGEVWLPHRIPLNVLALFEPYSGPAAFKRASAFASMLERIYSGIGPVQRARLIDVILELFDENAGRAPTLRQVLDRYREGQAADSVTSILNGFVLSQIFSEDPDELLTLDKAMKDKVLILDLNTFGADHQMKNALVVLFLDMFYEAMKRSTKVPFVESADGVTLRQVSSILLVDEASNIMGYDFPVLESLLKEGREFGVGTILSSQYLSHFKAKRTNFAETLSTWFVHKVPNVTAGELSSLGIAGSDKTMAERIKTLSVHESLFKSDLFPARFIRERPYWKLMEDRNAS